MSHPHVPPGPRWPGDLPPARGRTGWTATTAPYGSPAGHRPGGRDRALQVALGVLLAGVLLLATATAAVLAGRQGDPGPAAVGLPPGGQPKTKEPAPPADPDGLPDRPAPVVLGTAAIGETFTVGEYDLRVDAVTLDATELIRQTAAYDVPPEGQYVLLDVTAVYVGTTVGYPVLDVEFVFTGPGEREYSSDDCAASLPYDWTTAPTLPIGGSQTIQACIDVPAKDVDGGRLSVQDWYTQQRVDIGER